MAYSPNWITKVITIPVSDLTLISGTRYSLTMSDFLAECRRLEWVFTEGFWAPAILDHTNTRADFAGADYAPFDEVINGYTVTFSAPATRVDLLGSNNNIIDVLNVSGISIVPSNSAGLQLVETGVSGLTEEESAQLGSIDTKTEYLERAVWIDTEQIAAGDGSQALPFNNLTNAIDYAEAEGIKTLYVYADITLDRQLKNFKVIGVGTPTVDTNGQDLTKSEFWHCQMQGTYIGAIIAQESVLLTNFELNGYFEKCGLGGDLFCIDGSNILLTQCISVIPGTGRPTISMNATGTAQLSLRKNGGGMTIKDCNQATDTVTVEVSEGSLTFDSSCTNGEMVARGVCKFVDNSNGATVVDETLSPLDAQKSNQLLNNKIITDPVTGIMTVYAEDGSTVLYTANIYENSGGTIPYQGNAVNRRERFT